MKRKILFLIMFTILSLLAFQVPISQIVGSSQKFTLFEFFGPVGGMFLGPWLGAISAFFVRAINIIIKRQALDWLTIIRFLPAMMAAVYFGFKTNKTAIIFPICILLFVLNPIGRQAWLYSAIWLIPFVATFFNKRLILKSLGATMTAHAVGSVIFLYAFGLTPAIWLGLIPVVFIERGVFAFGIWASTLIFNNILEFLTNFKWAYFFKPIVDKNYVLNSRFFKQYA